MEQIPQIVFLKQDMVIGPQRFMPKRSDRSCFRPETLFSNVFSVLHETQTIVFAQRVRVLGPCFSLEGWGALDMLTDVTYKH